MHRLCIEIGGMTVNELMDRMTASEYTNWIKFYKHENEIQEQASKPQEPEEVDWETADLSKIFGVAK